MDLSQKTMFIIKVVRTLRMLGNGLLIIVFIKNLYQKEMYEPHMFMLQAALYFGTVFTSYLIKTNQHRIGTKNALLLSTLIMALTSIIFAESKNLYCLFITALVGMMPVVGQQIQIFQTIQQLILSKIIATNSKSKEELVEIKQKQMRNYKIIGQLSQLVSCIIVTYILSNTIKSLEASYNISLYMLRAYTIIVSLQFFIYLSLDKQQIQVNNTLGNTYSGKEILQCVRPGTFMLVTFFVFFSTSILNMTNFLYFLHQKYEMQIPEVAPIIISLIFINHLVGYLTKKLVQKKCSKIWLLLGLPFNLMFVFVALTQRLGKWQSITIVANLITNSFVLNFWQKLKYAMISEYELQTYETSIDLCKHFGTMFSIIVYAIFSIFGATTIPYSISIIISGAVKFVISIALMSCLSCLGNYSYNSKQNSQIFIYDRNFQHIKHYGDQHQNLHLSNTH